VANKINSIREFKDIGKEDAAIAGGKGASLGEMTKAGIPVPPGFVLLADAFQKFLEETNLNTEVDTILHSVDQREMHTVEDASAKIQAVILAAKMPEDVASEILEFYKKLDASYVAVRSSATAEDSASAAWAGQLDSYLNTTEDTLLANVQRCWASLFTPRAIFYRFEKELHETKISVAVVVQKMVQSEVSGIAFSVHPVTEDRNQLIIEAGFGLGEAIVSGQVTPDSYVIEKTPRRIIDKNVTFQGRALWRAESGGNEWRELSEVEGNKPALSDEQALELAEIILRIENHYGFPCDIEWAYEAEHFYITQSRPITTLSKSNGFTAESTGTQELLYIKGKDDYEVQGQWIIPLLAWSFWIPWAHSKKAVELGFKKIGSQYLMIDHRSFHEKDGLAQEVRDRTYAELSQGKETTTDKLFSNLEEMERQIVSAAEELEKDSDSLPLLKKALTLHAEGAFAVMLVDMMDSATEQVITEEIEKEKLDQAAVYSHIKDRKTASHFDFDHLRDFKAELLHSNFATGATIQEIGVKLPELVTDLRQYQKKTEYLGTHNCQGTGRTMERLLTSIFDTPPTFAVITIPLKMSATLTTALKVAELCIYWRTQMGEQFSRMMYAARPALTTFGNQYGMGYDGVMHATYEEIVDAINGSMSFNEEKVLSRIGKKVVMAASPQDGRVEVVSGPFVDLLEERFDIHAVPGDALITEIKGKIAFKGRVRGKVAVVMKSIEGEKVKEGMILVAPETTPDFIFAMNKAAAFVTDRGGITSHAAIIAREMRKPCIIGTKNGTRVLKDGDMVEVDANNGIVRKI